MSMGKIKIILKLWVISCLGVNNLIAQDDLTCDPSGISVERLVTIDKADGNVLIGQGYNFSPMFSLDQKMIAYFMRIRQGDWYTGLVKIFSIDQEKIIREFKLGYDARDCQFFWSPSGSGIIILNLESKYMYLDIKTGLVKALHHSSEGVFYGWLFDQSISEDNCLFGVKDAGYYSLNPITLSSKVIPDFNQTKIYGYPKELCADRMEFSGTDENVIVVSDKMKFFKNYIYRFPETTVRHIRSTNNKYLVLNHGVSYHLELAYLKNHVKLNKTVRVKWNPTDFFSERKGPGMRGLNIGTFTSDYFIVGSVYSSIKNQYNGLVMGKGNLLKAKMFLTRIAGDSADFLLLESYNKIVEGDIMTDFEFRSKEQNLKTGVIGFRSHHQDDNKFLPVKILNKEVNTNDISYDKAYCNKSSIIDKENYLPITDSSAGPNYSLNIKNYNYYTMCSNPEYSQLVNFNFFNGSFDEDALQVKNYIEQNALRQRLMKRESTSSIILADSVVYSLVCNDLRVQHSSLPGKTKTGEPISVYKCEFSFNWVLKNTSTGVIKDQWPFKYNGGSDVYLSKSEAFNSVFSKNTWKDELLQKLLSWFPPVVDKVIVIESSEKEGVRSVKLNGGTKMGIPENKLFNKGTFIIYERSSGKVLAELKIKTVNEYDTLCKVTKGGIDLQAVLNSNALVKVVYVND